MDRHSIERARQVVTDVINAWNPYGLLPELPADEFNAEVNAIVGGIDRARSPAEMSALISSVFTSWFDDPERFAHDRCEDVGREMFRRLTEAGLLSS